MKLEENWLSGLRGEVVWKGKRTDRPIQEWMENGQKVIIAQVS